MQRLDLSEKLADAVAEAKRITNFEGKRRQMQYIGKLMRGLDEKRCRPIRDALDEQQQGLGRQALALHEAEQWRDDLIANDDALDRWLRQHPGTDTQQLRALIRQARKDAQPDAGPGVQGRGRATARAYREIFQLVKEQLVRRTPAGRRRPDPAGVNDHEHRPFDPVRIGIVSVSDRASGRRLRGQGPARAEGLAEPRPEEPDHLRLAPDPRRAGSASAPR